MISGKYREQEGVWCTLAVRGGFRVGGVEGNSEMLVYCAKQFIFRGL